MNGCQRELFMFMVPAALGKSGKVTVPFIAMEITCKISWKMRKPAKKIFSVIVDTFFSFYKNVAFFGH